MKIGSIPNAGRTGGWLGVVLLATSLFIPGLTASAASHSAVYGPVTVDTRYVIIKANGAVGDVSINYPDPMTITIEVNGINNADTPVDWWVLSLAGSSWYYLNNAVQWKPFDGNLSNCHPLHQGALCNLPSTLLPELNIPGLPVSSYTFWFIVDYPMNGVLNLNGPFLADAVNVTVLSTTPAPCVKANGITSEITVNYPEPVAVTIEMNARAYAGVPADWWVIACVNGTWYYMDSVAGWTQAGVLRPVYQGGLGNLPATEVLSGVFPRGSYTFFFAVDFPMDGILNLDGLFWADAVNVIVQ